MAGDDVFDHYKKKLDYTFLSNHALVYLMITENPNASIKEISEAIKITERSVHGMLLDLTRDGYVTITKHGKYNSYGTNLSIPVRKRSDQSIMRGKDLFDAWSGRYDSWKKMMKEHLESEERPA